MLWELPESVEIGEKTYAVNADYRDIISIINQLNDLDEDETVNVYTAFAMFYPDYESIPYAEYETAVNEMFRFINCGEKPEADSHPVPKRIDWEQDGLIIAADINKHAQQDIRSVPFMHWWTFMSLFAGIGDGQLSLVVSIRDKLRKGQPLDKWEKEYYRENKSRVDLKKRYSAEELEERERINKLLDA